MVLCSVCSAGCGSDDIESADAERYDTLDTTDSDGQGLDDGDDSDGSAQCVAAELPSEPGEDPKAVRFILNRRTALDQHIFVPTPADLDRGGYGGGGALIDYNDDGLVDVFLVRRAPEGTPTCLYENTSTDTTTSFRKASCFPEIGKAGGARVTDFDGDSNEELLVYGDDSVHLFDGADLSNVETVFTRDELDNPCLIRSAIAHPSDQNAVIIFFGELADPSDGSIINICEPLVVRKESGTYTPSGTWQQADFKPNTLAVGRADVDADGVLDTALAVDTFSNEDRKNTGAHPGGIVRGILGSDTSPVNFVPWIANSTRAWGSFMGINRLLVGMTPATFLSDLGIPLIRTDTTGDNIAALLPATATGDPNPFSWSPIVADFNLDQRDDVVLTRGTVPEPESLDNEESDTFLVQTDEGFEDHTASSGLLAHPDAYPDRTDPRHYSRAGAVTDFDRDGKLELLIMPLEGRPLLYESNLATHCLADMNTSYTNPANELYGWSWLDHRGNPHALRVDGHMRLGQPEWVPLPAGRGVVRAPSGSRIPYNCEVGERISISEPTWAEVQSDSLFIDLCAANIEDQLVQHRKSGTNSWEPLLAGDQGLAIIPIGSDRQELRINGKFALSCGNDGDCSR